MRCMKSVAQDGNTKDEEEFSFLLMLAKGENVLLKDLIKDIKKYHDLPSKEIMTLEGRKVLLKNDIYRIAGCLYENINTKDELDELLASKKKTWKKYIDCFQRTFNIEFSKKIPIVNGLICSLFLLFLDNQYTLKESEKKQKFIRSIIKKENSIRFAELSYKEKNELIDYLENIFDIVDYEKYGIAICMNEIDTKNLTRFPKEIPFSVIDLEKFKRNQSALELLAEISAYSDEIYSVLSQWRFNTGLAEMLRRYEQHISNIFDICTQQLLEGLSDELNSRAKEMLFTQSYCNEHKFAKEMKGIFRNYIKDNFMQFKNELITRSNDFDLDPDQLLK